MEESTFETFEDELGGPLQEEPSSKSVEVIRRPDVHATKKVKEEPLSPQHVPKSAPKELSRTTSLRRALSIQNLSQIEGPWQGITLNRCLFVAITILVISSGCQRLHEALKSLRAVDHGKSEEEGLTLRHMNLKEDRALPQPEPETSLWDTLFWWVMEDDDDQDEDEESPEGKPKKKEVKGSGDRGASGKEKRRETPGKPLPEKEGRVKEKREKKGRKQQDDQTEKGKRRSEKRVTVEQWEEDEEEEEQEEEEEVKPRKKQKEESQKREKRQKGSEVTPSPEKKSGRRGHRYALYEDTFKRKE
ncbi:hypothetical protein MATL_G00239920 [Megalops atlanticus]|uniref:Uncharacterized protein n=1 Tax=Megalops atlanticus TaxID=7932 RepID=A0A9D3PDP7_MEGAT|nr:hypothetical protein MATL_G00239920 [Megalops atlanticus]